MPWCHMYLTPPKCQDCNGHQCVTQNMVTAAYATVVAETSCAKIATEHSCLESLCHHWLKLLMFFLLIIIPMDNQTCSNTSPQFSHLFALVSSFSWAPPSIRLLLLRPGHGAMANIGANDLRTTGKFLSWELVPEATTNSAWWIMIVLVASVYWLLAQSYCAIWIALGEVIGHQMNQIWNGTLRW